jgi:hypothetical protein
MRWRRQAVRDTLVNSSSRSTGTIARSSRSRSMIASE